MGSILLQYPAEKLYKGNITEVTDRNTKCEVKTMKRKFQLWSQNDTLRSMCYELWSQNYEVCTMMYDFAITLYPVQIHILRLKIHTHDP